MCRPDGRDVYPTRTADQARKRRQGKSDALDSERIARETATHADLPPAFKRAHGDSGVDENQDLMALWHNTRRSLAKIRAQLLLRRPDAATALQLRLLAEHIKMRERWDLHLFGQARNAVLTVDEGNVERTDHQKRLPREAFLRT